MTRTTERVRRYLRYPMDVATRKDLNTKLEKSVAWHLTKNNSEDFGMKNRMRVAKLYNYLRNGRSQRVRRAAYRHHFDALIADNGSLRTTPIRIQDGWAVDSSRTLPHLEAFVRDAHTVIQERGGQKGRGTLFIQNRMTDADLERFPSFIDFATSSDVLAAASSYLGMVPILSDINLFESSAALDPDAKGFNSSQLFHLDDSDIPFARAIVHVSDVTREHGPFCFLPVSASQAAQKALGYRQRGRSYRVTDEEMWIVVDKRALVEAAHPSGTVLWVDPCQCFHYVSRDATKPRYVAMVDFCSPSRTDFRQILSPRRFTRFMRAGDSRLRRMVLDDNFVDAPNGRNEHH